jgi:AGCS family alanine or glycine:cation symporter
LAIVFCFFGLLGVSPIFQSNQIVEVFNSVILKDQFFFNNKFYSDLLLGLTLAIIVSFVILGGISRIGKVASKIAPVMVLVYMVTVFYLMIINYHMIIPSIKLIFTDAFSANSVLGGSIASIILIGARRASFSNEAGIGTAPIIHASSQSENPIEEGLVSMIGPFVDTIIVCTLTALCILVTDSWTNFNYAGIELVAEAFNSSMPTFGPYILLFTTLTFAISTLFSLSFFGERCMAYLFGEKNKIAYRYIYLCLIVIGSVSSLKFVISLIDLSYGIMAFPTIISALFLAPKVDKMSKKYFKKLK